MQKGLCEKAKGLASKRRQPSKRMSRCEVEELMGVKRDIYKRVNGAVRRK